MSLSHVTISSWFGCPPPHSSAFSFAVHYRDEKVYYRDEFFSQLWSEGILFEFENFQTNFPQFFKIISWWHLFSSDHDILVCVYIFEPDARKNTTLFTSRKTAQHLHLLGCRARRGQFRRRPPQRCPAWSRDRRVSWRSKIPHNFTSRSVSGTAFFFVINLCSISKVQACKLIKKVQNQSAIYWFTYTPMATLPNKISRRPLHPLASGCPTAPSWPIALLVSLQVCLTSATNSQNCDALVNLQIFSPGKCKLSSLIWGTGLLGHPNKCFSQMVHKNCNFLDFIPYPSTPHLSLTWPRFRQTCSGATSSGAELGQKATGVPNRLRQFTFLDFVSKRGRHVNSNRRWGHL